MSHGQSMRYFEKNSKSTKTVNHTRIDSISSIEGKYRICDDILGQGSFGTVYKATNIATNQSFAMKTIEKQTLGVMGHKMLEREVAILKRVYHPHIVTLEEVFETSEHTYLFMELCDKGELKSIIDARRLSELECAKIIERLASAIAYLHDNDIVHRDLKMENILLSGEIPDDPYNIKVTDFGLSFLTGGSSTFGSDKMMTTTCGTPMYMAPEILDNCVGYSHQCDIWSIGVIMFILLSGATPFVAENEDELYEKIKAGDIKFEGEQWSSISESAKTLIKCMIKVDPASRITAKELRDHPWVRGEVSSEVEEDSQMTVIEMMKMFHREKLIESEVKISEEKVELPVLPVEVVEVVETAPSPRKKFTPKGGVSPRRQSLQPTSQNCKTPPRKEQRRKPADSSSRSKARSTDEKKQINDRTVK